MNLTIEDTGEIYIEQKNGQTNSYERWVGRTAAGYEVEVFIYRIRPIQSADEKFFLIDNGTPKHRHVAKCVNAFPIRLDAEGRDVSQLPGLWSDTDTIHPSNC